MKIFCTLLFLISSASAFACKCLEFNVGEYLKFSNKVYLGEVVSFEGFGTDGLMSVSLKVNERFVGETFNIEEVIVNTRSGCRVLLDTGETFLVFEPKGGRVNNCIMRNVKNVPDLQWNLKALRKIRQLGI